MDGEAYYQRCVAILAEIEDAESGFRDAKPRGLLRVDVHGTLARHFVLPALPAFLAEYPELQLQMSEGDRLVDLVREGIDCVLRVGDLQDGAMIARRVAMLTEVTCASPAYLARWRCPPRCADLDGHVAVALLEVLGHRRRIAAGIYRGRCLSKSRATGQRHGGRGRILCGGRAIRSWPHTGSVLPRCRSATSPGARWLKFFLNTGLLPRPYRFSIRIGDSRRCRVRVFIDWLAREFAKHPDVSIIAG